MKTVGRVLLVVVVCFFACSTYGQIDDDMPKIPSALLTVSSTPLPDPSTWSSTPIDWSSSVRQFAEAITNNETGEVTTEMRQVIAVGDGLNYIDETTGAWRESEDLIEMLPDGTAAASRCPTKVFFVGKGSSLYFSTFDLLGVLS